MESNPAEEIYQESNTAPQNPIGGGMNQNYAILSESELAKKHKEFLNAIRTENHDLIDDMIQKYQSTYDIINRVDPETGQTSIYLAAILNTDEASTRVSEKLVANGGNVRFKDNYSQSAFFHVAREGKPNLLQLYYTNGADMNEQDGFKQTPLFYASRDGKTEAVRMMIEFGADVNIFGSYQMI